MWVYISRADFSHHAAHLQIFARWRSLLSSSSWVLLSSAASQALVSTFTYIYNPMSVYKVNIRCSTKDIQVMIDKLKMIFSLHIAFSCDGLRFTSDSPNLVLQPDGNYTLTFVFEHGNTGGDYTCFLREQESCPRVSTEISCLTSPNIITFTVLGPGVWYTLGVRCQLGNVVRSIARGIATPAADGDCVPLLYLYCRWESMKVDRK